MALAAWRASPWTGSLVRWGSAAGRSRWAVGAPGLGQCSPSPVRRKHLLDGPGLRRHRGGQAERVLPLRGHLPGAGQATGHHSPSGEGVRHRAEPPAEGHGPGRGQSSALRTRWRRTPATLRDRPLVPNPAGFNRPFTGGLSFPGAPRGFVGASSSENPSGASPDWLQLWAESRGDAN